MSAVAPAATVKPDLAAKPFLVRRAAVLGAGTMGSRIAAHLANAGIPVLLLDLFPQATARVIASPSVPSPPSPNPSPPRSLSHHSPR